MNNFARFGLGTDNTKIAGRAYSATDRLGPVDFQFENLGTNTATIIVKELAADGLSYTDLIASFTVAPGGRITKSAVIHTKQVGFFGEGNTIVSVHIPHPYAAALRGGHIDVEPVGRKGWGFDTAVDRNHLFPALD